MTSLDSQRGLAAQKTQLVGNLLSDVFVLIAGN